MPMPSSLVVKNVPKIRSGLLLRDAGAAVMNGEGRPAVLARGGAQLDAARPALLRLHGVDEQVDHDLLQLDPVAEHPGQAADRGCVDRSIDRDSISWRTNSKASSMISFRSSGTRSGSRRAAMPRMRCTMLLARRRVLRDPVVSWPTLARFGSSRDSHRWLVSALVTMAASGWLISCAVERGQFAEHRDPRRARIIGLELAQLRLGAQPIGDVLEAEDRHVEPVGRRADRSPTAQHRAACRRGYAAS